MKESGGTMTTLNTLTNVKGARKRRMRVGRGMGSGKGKTCGRGHKGQMARSGHKHKPLFEGGQMRLLRRMPKRGFDNSLFAVRYEAVNVGALARFPAGSEVTVEILQQSGLGVGRDVRIKILGQGELPHALRVKAHAFSESARRKIEAAGGTAEEIG